MRLFGSLIFIALLAGGAFAQHCPFDGGEMLVIELIDQKGEPMFGSSLDLTLVETDNPNADACKYSPGLITRGFRSPVEAFLARYSRQDSDVFREFCEDCSFDKDGFYAVVLGQAERSCMLEEGDRGPKPRRTRTYEVRYSRDGMDDRSQSAAKTSSACVPAPANGRGSSRCGSRSTRLKSLNLSRRLLLLPRSDGRGFRAERSPRRRR